MGNISVFNMNMEALHGSNEDYNSDADGESIKSNKAELINVDTSVQPDTSLEDLVLNRRDSRFFQSLQRHQKKHYDPRKLQSWHSMVDGEQAISPEFEHKGRTTKGAYDIQSSSDALLEKLGFHFYAPGKMLYVNSRLGFIKTQIISKADSVQEITPDCELAINCFDERFFGKVQRETSEKVPDRPEEHIRLEKKLAVKEARNIKVIINQKRMFNPKLTNLTPNEYYDSKNIPDFHIKRNTYDENIIKMINEIGMSNSNNESSNVDSTTYELEKYEKNYMIIFNHENFNTPEGKRLGTALDVAALEDTFRQFRFQVTTHHDLQQNDLFIQLRQFSRRDFKTCGCICVVILTHGQDHGYLRAYDTRYCERDVIACFDARLNPSLVGKPIIFLIQACRGRYPSPVIEPQSKYPLSTPTVELDTIHPTEQNRRPMDSDIIMFHSSFFGRASIRIVEEGTWFIQTLCEQIRLHAATDHIEKIFRRVRTVVAGMECQGAKQMPVVTSTLLKKLFLHRVADSHPKDALMNALREKIRREFAPA